MILFCFIPHGGNVNVYNALSWVLRVVGVHNVSVVHKHVRHGRCCSTLVAPAHISAQTASAKEATERIDPIERFSRRAPKQESSRMVVFLRCVFRSGHHSGACSTLQVERAGLLNLMRLVLISAWAAAHFADLRVSRPPHSDQFLETGKLCRCVRICSTGGGAGRESAWRTR